MGPGDGAKSLRLGQGSLVSGELFCHRLTNGGMAFALWLIGRLLTNGSHPVPINTGLTPSIPSRHRQWLLPEIFVQCSATLIFTLMLPKYRYVMSAGAILFSSSYLIWLRDDSNWTTEPRNHKAILYLSQNFNHWIWYLPVSHFSWNLLSNNFRRI